MKVNSRLTFNVGVRWDYTAPWTDTDQRMINFDLNAMTLDGKGTQLYNADLNNFAPRLGVAYDAQGNGRTVVRGGYGLYYNAFAAQSAYQLLFGNLLGSMNLNRTTNPDLKYPLPAIAGGVTSPPAFQSIPARPAGQRQSPVEHQRPAADQRQHGRPDWVRREPEPQQRADLSDQPDQPDPRQAPRHPVLPRSPSAPTAAPPNITPCSSS